MAINKKLRKLAGQPQPGVSPAELEGVESRLGVKLLNELRTLYADHNGAVGLGDLPWRLLTVTEVLQVNQHLSAAGILPAHIKLFWGDDEGNYAGCYFGGRLHGKVCFFNHEERDFAPRYTGLPSFMTALAEAAGSDAFQMPGDLPPAHGLDQATGKLGKLAQDFQTITDPRKRRQLAWDIIALTPPDRAADVFSFLDDPDLHVQERAAEALGKWQYSPAIPRLAEVAHRETTKVHNARIAAILALGRMRTAAGLESLLELSKTVPQAFHSYIYRALELHGGTIKFEAGQWKYRLPGEQHWQSLK